MPCYHPIAAFRGGAGRPLVFGRAPAGREQLWLPCGKCIGCRVRLRSELALRAIHESKLHDDLCWITLTYDPLSLPYTNRWRCMGSRPRRGVDGDFDGMVPSLFPRDLTLFLKRLRKSFSPHTVRYLACGEYGGLFGRPHYHAILYGWCPDFRTADAYGHFTSDSGVRSWQSHALDALWTLGRAVVSDYDDSAARYVASYVLKKIGDPLVDDGIAAPPFVRASSRPGLGAGYLRRFRRDMVADDGSALGVRGSHGVRAVPRYYRDLIRRDNPALADRMRWRYALSGDAGADPDLAVLDRREDWHNYVAAEMKGK